MIIYLLVNTKFNWLYLVFVNIIFIIAHEYAFCHKYFIHNNYIIVLCRMPVIIIYILIKNR